MPERAQAQTFLGFDFGTRHIGVAIGNSLTGQAHALETISTHTRIHRFTRITALLEKWQPDTVIVGLPLATDGSEQLATVQARRFANQLRGRYGLTVELADERGSSLEAQERLASHAPDHAEAAAVILQRYLDGARLPKSVAEGTAPAPVSGHSA
ncbi:MAG TPA: Holliday junction resolvase RuvX [Burkholderiaceae bacterium]|nr:Holliday junction resolvase RuvX [Burkholderiaceae bacterium]